MESSYLQVVKTVEMFMFYGMGQIISKKKLL